MKFKTIIVDNEKKDRLALAGLLKRHCQSIEVCAESDSVKSALTAIEEHRPDLIFLNIEMPTESGFTLYDHIGMPDFETIFTTEHEHYAVKAFRFPATDYLLKPLEVTALCTAVRKVLKNKSENGFAEEGVAPGLKQNHQPFMNKLALATQDGLFFIELDEIIFCEAQGNYTSFYLGNNEKILASKTLKIYSGLLCNYGFYRINRSHLINLRHVRNYGKQKNPVITLSTGSSLILGKSRKKDFLQKIAVV